MVVRDEQSERDPIYSGVLQDIFLGPLIWNIFFDDLLQQIPEVVACAEDITIHLSFSQDNANRSSTIIVPKWIQFTVKKQGSNIKEQWSFHTRSPFD